MSMKLTAQALDMKLGSPITKLVLVCMADIAGKDGTCFPSYQHIADQCEISKRSVIEHIKKLEALGFISKQERKTKKGNSSNIYQVELCSEPPAPPSESPASPPSEPAAPRTSNSPEPVNEPRESAVRVAHYLHEKLTKEIPEIKANPQSWITEIERAIRIDGRTEQDLIAIIDWMHKGDKFWVANIQSGKKLREKYNTMIAQKRQQQPAKEAAPASQRTFAENQRIADEVEKQHEAARQAAQPRNVTPIHRNRPVSLKQVLADAKRGSK